MHDEHTIVLLGAISLRVVTWHILHRRAHEEIRALLDALTDDTTQTDVKSLVEKFDHLALYGIDGEDTWKVETPLMFSGENWVAWIDFVDERVSQVRVRIFDNALVRPPDGPPDVVFDVTE